ncbi:MAG: DUF1552 domain-containing protein [Bryobacteraceae bacterium]
MITRKHLPRRTFLRGVGTAIALPVLDAMSPAFAAPRRADEKLPVRMAFVYVPNGIVMGNWTPAAEGPAFEMTRSLTPLAPLRKDLSVISGLAQMNGRALADGAGDHARAAASFLTGVHPRKTDGADIQGGVSVDQIAAQTAGSQTRFGSLELGCEHGRMVGNCDSGYSCAYSNSLAWRTPTTPMPPEVNPRLVFERLFGSGDRIEDPATRARRQRLQKSILDYVQDDAQRLSGSLGTTDRRKLDEYLFAVRDIEKRIETAEKQDREATRPDVTPRMDRPDGIPAEYDDHVRLMFDLMAVAFQADLTRVATFMMGREGSNRTYRQIGVPDAHHGISHHRDEADKIEKLTKINTYHVTLFAEFLNKLGQTRDGERSLLDNSMIVYGSGLSDGNQHWHHDLPLVLAGKGGGLFKSGRHIKYRSETPMNNLFLAMLDTVGVRTDKLGDSNGRLNYLTDL